MKFNKNNVINLAWIDYQKAYDSVPHSWIKEILDIYKIDKTTTNFINHSMQHWKTKLKLNHTNGTTITTSIPIRRGIFQGDSMSPLIFCMCLFPLTNLLNRTKIGVSISNRKEKKINHLMYMDDIKIYANGDKNMSRLLNLLQKFNEDVNMTLGVEKCATLRINNSTIEPETLNSLPVLDPEIGYQYLGLLESSKFHQSCIKENAKKEFYKRTRKILSAKLNGLNTSIALKTFAVPILRYTFGIIHWTTTELHQLDRKLRKILFQCKYHHPKSDTNNIYVPRSQGGRGIPCIYDIYVMELSKLATYLTTSSDTLLKEVRYFEGSIAPTKSILRYQPSGPNFKEQKTCDDAHQQQRNSKLIYGNFFRTQEITPTINLQMSQIWLKNHTYNQR